MTRYNNRGVKLNESTTSKKHRENRGISGGLKHYRMERKKAPTLEEIGRLNNVAHIWKTGDKFYKLAHKHYNDTELWWIISWYNKKPTEAHVNVGDVIYIPMPLERVYEILES
jgi:nucleoid-associated protein YgaU